MCVFMYVCVYIVGERGLCDKGAFTSFKIRTSAQHDVICYLSLSFFLSIFLTVQVVVARVGAMLDIEKVSMV